MNVLILTAKFGYGHYSAAEAIKEKLILESTDNNVIIIDFLEYILPKLSKVIYKSYNMLVNKCPGVYNLLSILTPQKNNAPLKKFVANKIDKLLENYNVDTIISVVPICSEYISAYKKVRKSNIQLNTYVTDVDVHTVWINDLTSYYFVPSERTKEYLITKNIRETNIIVSGIPVKSEFNKERTNNNKKNVLIMGGGLGLIPKIDEFIDQLNKESDINLTIILGTNKRLYKKLSKKYKNIKILGFVNNVYDYMLESDLIITKAGGITTFEAIMSKTPLYIIKPFLAQEKGNAEYIEEKQIGRIIWKNNKNIGEDIINLLNNENDLSKMKNNMTKLSKELNKITFGEYLKREEEAVC